MKDVILRMTTGPDIVGQMTEGAVNELIVGKAGDNNVGQLETGKGLHGVVVTDSVLTNATVYVASKQVVALTVV